MLTQIKIDILTVVDYLGESNLVDLVNLLDVGEDGEFDTADIIQAVNELVDSGILNKQDGILTINENENE